MRTGSDGRSVRGVGVVVMVSAKVVSIVHLLLGNPRKNHTPSSISATSVSEEVARSRCTLEMAPPKQIQRDVNRA